MKDSTLLPKYADSHALVIGINKYTHASPLGYAVNDAEAFAEILSSRFHFPKANITLLKDAEASRTAIMSAYLGYSKSTVGRNDRLIVFFAGHGMTVPGNTGDTGFLIPCDGKPDELATLVGWRDLTFNADLIRAKHVLFIMDACYGGLALTRSAYAGSVRFLRDMLRRPVRQVLTAGKADEVVSDAGGPKAGHSVFTGHLLEALEGAAASTDGIITARGVMSYVYGKVAKDQHSNQTPEFGCLNGDGDLVLLAPQLDSPAAGDDKTGEQDIMVTIPSTDIADTSVGKNGLVEVAKQYLSDAKDKIKLHDLAIQEVRRFGVLSSTAEFPNQKYANDVDEFLQRLKRYEEITTDLRALVACMAYWGTPTHSPTLAKVLSLATGSMESEAGYPVWSALRCYPTFLLTCTAGIAALAAQNYTSLSAVLNADTPIRDRAGRRRKCGVIVVEKMLELDQMNAFKRIPDHNKYYTPRSEYAFKLFQTDLDDILFLGGDYERLFDRFEVFWSLFYADVIYTDKTARMWGPLGRFAWKRSHSVDDPFGDFVAEATAMGSQWEPLKAGFFRGSHERFAEVAKEFEAFIGRAIP